MCKDAQLSFHRCEFIDIVEPFPTLTGGSGEQKWKFYKVNLQIAIDLYPFTFFSFFLNVQYISSLYCDYSTDCNAHYYINSVFKVFNIAIILLNMTHVRVFRISKKMESLFRIPN